MLEANHDLGIIYHAMAKNAFRRRYWKQSSEYMGLAKYYFSKIPYSKKSGGFLL